MKLKPQEGDVAQRIKKAASIWNRRVFSRSLLTLVFFIFRSAKQDLSTFTSSLFGAESHVQLDFFVCASCHKFQAAFPPQLLLNENTPLPKRINN